jgi:hypothetical protein
MESMPLAVPVGPDGKPLAMVGFTMKELIPTVQYGNCDVGPAFAYRFVEDNEDSRRKGMEECVADVKYVLGAERNTILEVLRTQRKNQPASS